VNPSRPLRRLGSADQLVSLGEARVRVVEVVLVPRFLELLEGDPHGKQEHEAAQYLAHRLAVLVLQVCKIPCRKLAPRFESAILPLTLQDRDEPPKDRSGHHGSNAPRNELQGFWVEDPVQHDHLPCSWGAASPELQHAPGRSP
jgi:hypothetical protein